MSSKSMSGMFLANQSSIGLRSNRFSALSRNLVIHSGSSLLSGDVLDDVLVQALLGRVDVVVGAVVPAELVLAEIDALDGHGATPWLEGPAGGRPGDFHYGDSNNPGRARTIPPKVTVSGSRAVPRQRPGVPRAWVPRMFALVLVRGRRRRARRGLTPVVPASLGRAAASWSSMSPSCWSAPGSRRGPGLRARPGPSLYGRSPRRAARRRSWSRRSPVAGGCGLRSRCRACWRAIPLKRGELVSARAFNVLPIAAVPL